MILLPFVHKHLDRLARLTSELQKQIPATVRLIPVHLLERFLATIGLHLTPFELLMIRGIRLPIWQPQIFMPTVCIIIKAIIGKSMIILHIPTGPMLETAFTLGIFLATAGIIGMILLGVSESGMGQLISRLTPQTWTSDSTKLIERRKRGAHGRAPLFQ